MCELENLKTGFCLIYILWFFGVLWCILILHSFSYWHDCLIFFAPDEECVKQRIKYVPACLKQKKARNKDEEVGQEKASKDEGSQMDPPSSDSDRSDSEDSMSDLYPGQSSQVHTA